MRRSRPILLTVVTALLVTAVAAPASVGAATPLSFTILHTNDFHGQLEASGSNPGMARVATIVNGVRTAVHPENVLLVDAGDEMQGSLLSNLGDGTATGKGVPTIATFNAMDYAAATFGNHEFDWGQVNLAARTAEADYPYVTANIVQNDTGNCDTAGWTKPAFAEAPYTVATVGTTPDQIQVAFIGVTTSETPTITISTSTAGLCFKDPASSILHYYDDMKDEADVVVVLSHLGYPDGGYGYGIPVYGDQTLAQKLITAGKPADLVIGGHSHTNLSAATVVTVAGKTGQTPVVQAYYNGRRVGRADIVVDGGSKAVTSVTWQSLVVVPPGAKDSNNNPIPETAEDSNVKTLIATFAAVPAYQTLINQPVGYSAVDLPRLGGTVDNMMGTFVDDAIYNHLNADGEPANDVDLFFNNAGGIRADWCYNGTTWVNTGCVGGTHAPALLTYGNMFTILPFGNATVVGDMTGAQILQVLNQAPLVTGGVIQPAGLEYKYYAYKQTDPTSTADPPTKRTYAWGAFDYCVVNKSTEACDPLDLNKVYKVGTNEFLAPAGGDGYGGFKYMTNVTYWGDMLNAVNAYVAANHGTVPTAYRGPNGNGTLDGRIVRDGTDAPDSGSIIPITILHNNDSHGNLAKGSFVGYTQLATLINQERYYNPARTILLNGGDQVQGDAMMYYFKSAPSGFAADGTALPDALKTHPMMAVMNALGYEAMTLGNHEFNFGGTVFAGIFNQATFPLLGANVSDDGRYGLAGVGKDDGGVLPAVEVTRGGVKIAVVGITNHRVPNYELPSNILGLTFSDPIAAAEDEVAALRASNDVVVALTHIGFTENPSSVEVDANVDTNLAVKVPGIDAIVGAHSHTDPSKQTAYSGAYKFLPTIVGGPSNSPVIVGQAYRYNNYLGEIVLGVRAKAGGGYEVVARAGAYLAVTSTTPEDPAIKAIVDPYVAQLDTYNSRVVGETTVPIDTLQAFTTETNGANLQADASVWELAQHGITDVDVHLSGAMTNKVIPPATPPATFPATLKISDMFAGMPYENSLVVLRMNGPQLKAVLERGYRNYYYYKYVPGYGGYSYYTTCMLDTNKVGQIQYRDTSPALPDGNNVMALKINGKAVDFANASKYYNVSTVNYLAAGSCNFNDGGKSLWPLEQIVHDTQYYVRDAVIDYITAMGTVSPKIEGRLLFADTDNPVVTIKSPSATKYQHYRIVPLTWTATDATSGVKTVVAEVDGTKVTGASVDMHTLALGSHTLKVTATDFYGNSGTASVRFTVATSIDSLIRSVERYRASGDITKNSTSATLLGRLVLAKVFDCFGMHWVAANQLKAFVNHVEAQTGKSISRPAGALLVSDAKYLIKHL